MLLAHTVATIEAVDHEECALVLDSANAFQPEQSIEYKGKPLPILHNYTDKLWLDHMPPVHEGDTLTQTHPLTDLDQIYEAFQTEWMARWDRHANAVDSRWEPIIDFVRIAIPNPPRTQYNSISYATWQNAVGRKTDGVSEDDLLALPWNHVEPVLRLLDDIEQGRTLATTGCHWTYPCPREAPRSLEGQPAPTVDGFLDCIPNLVFNQGP